MLGGYINEGVEKKSRVRYEGQKKGLAHSKVRLLLALLPSPTPPHPSPPSLQTRQQDIMPPAATISTSPPPRPPSSSIIEAVQRSPILSPKIADPKQQRSGSVRPPSPPLRLSTPPQPPLDQKPENGSKKPEVSTRRFSGPILPLAFFWSGIWGPRIAHSLTGLHSLSICLSSSRSWSWMILDLAILLGKWPQTT